MGERPAVLGPRHRPTLNPVFNEDWFPEASCRAVARAVGRTRHLVGRVIEVGCWEGRSTAAIANACYPAMVEAVDTWEGSPGEPSALIAADRDVYATFEHNMGALTRGNVEAHRMGWREYFTEDRGPVRFLHIDAEHTYSEVRDTIESVLPLMVAGGIICGDDRHHAPVLEAVRDTLGDAAYDATLWVWSADD